MTTWEGLAFFGAQHARVCCGQHRCTSTNGWRKWCGVLRHTSPWVSRGQNCTNLINTLACPTGPRGMGINSHVPADCDQALRLQSQVQFHLSNRCTSQESLGPKRDPESQTLNLKLLGLLIDDVYHCICYRLRLDEACHAHSWFVFVFFSSRPKVSRQLQLPATTHTRERSTGDVGYLP